MNNTVCNICGHKFNFWDSQESFNIKVQAGYGTKYDGDYIDLNLCCNCMDNLIEACAISPIQEIHNK